MEYRIKIQLNEITTKEQAEELLQAGRVEIYTPDRSRAAFSLLSLLSGVPEASISNASNLNEEEWKSLGQAAQRLARAEIYITMG